MSKVEAAFEQRTGVVMYDPDRVTIDTMISTITDLGYHAQVKLGPSEGSER